MLTRLAAVPFAIAMFSGVLASQAHACACCASTGQRHVTSGKIADHDAAELRRVVFNGRARLLTGEAEPSELRGLSAATSEYDVEVSRRAANWTFTFKTGNDVAGTLSFAPDKLAKFEVDTRMGETGDGNVTLYKEWKQTAPVWADGMFKLPKGSALSLILQGRGNGCTSADDFRHWALVAQGGDFSFQFFGDLEKPR
jgi:hypothetical protein